MTATISAGSRPPAWPIPDAPDGFTTSHSSFLRTRESRPSDVRLPLAPRLRGGDDESYGQIVPTHAEQRVLPYTPEQLFALVADIERYPEFLPWCIGARIRERKPDLIVAD